MQYITCLDILHFYGSTWINMGLGSSNRQYFMLSCTAKQMIYFCFMYIIKCAYTSIASFTVMMSDVLLKKLRYNFQQEENWFADDCVERTLEVKRDGENDRRIVTQFQYTGWPDHGIPDDIDVILTMIAKMREIRAHDKSFAPVVVHCRFKIDSSIIVLTVQLFNQV